MENCYIASTPMISDLKITDNPVEDKEFVWKYQDLIDSHQFLTTYIRPDIVFATGFLEYYNNAPM